MNAVVKLPYLGKPRDADITDVYRTVEIPFSGLRASHAAYVEETLAASDDPASIFEAKMERIASSLGISEEEAQRLYFNRI